MEPCKDCVCDCIPVSKECIVKLSEIPKWEVVKENHLSNATDDVADLIGNKCSEELCQALSAAIKEVNLDPGKTVSDFLAKKWLNVIENKHFKKWYANRVLWHWLEGASISELKLVGLVVPENTDESFTNGFQMATEAERKRLQRAAANYASGARLKFLEIYWFCNTSLYDCTPLCSCQKTSCQICDPEGVSGRGLSIGMDIV